MIGNPYDTKSILKEWVETDNVPAPYAGVYCVAELFKEPDYGAESIVISRVFISQAQLDKRRKAGTNEPKESPLAALFRQSF